MISVTRIYQICLILVCLVASEYLCATPLPVQDGYYWVQFNNTTYSSYYLKAPSRAGGISYSGRPSQPNILITRDAAGNFKLTDRTNNGVLGIYSPAQFTGQAWVITLGQATGALYPSTAASSFSGTAITGGDYNTFGWKPIPTPSTNITLNFSGKAATDLHIGLRYSSTNCIEIVLGGWNNSASKIRVVEYTSGISVRNEYPATSPNPVMTDIANPIQYVLKIANGVITITGKLSNGSTYTALTFNQASFGVTILNTPFTGYSFRAYPAFPWTMASDTVSSVPATITYNGTCNGYSGQSTVSQADADLQARMAWLNAKIPTGTLVNTQLSAWKTIPNPVAGNVKLVFTGAALMDLWVYFKSSDGMYFYLVLGGWSNTKAVIRNFSSAGAQQGGDIYLGPLPTIPDTVNPVMYTVTIMNGQLTLTTVAGGVTSTRVTYSDAALLNKTFSAYTFGNFVATTPWKYTGDTVSANTFTGTYSGYSAQSTVSQQDANNKAQAAWATAVVTSIGNAKTTAVNAVNPVLTAITNSRNALTAGRKAFTDIALQLDTLAGRAGFTPKLPWQT